MKLTLADIKPAPWNARKITPESVAELAASIREQGLIQPIVVWRDGNGNALCIAGNRRLAAMKAIGYDLADAEVIDFEGDESQAREVTITENLQREGLDILDEAAAVTALLSLGNEPKEVAAKLGKSVTWVRRREKLTALDEAWVKRAKDGAIDADALEHICAYPANIQAAVAKENGWAKHWRDLSASFDRESRDLDAAKFDTDAADCAACAKRTGAEADLFGVCDGKLGKCLDCHCFDARVKIWLDAEIRRLTGNAETVRVKYAWELPSGEDASDKRTKKHPCAYVFVYNSTIEVKWGESKKAKEEREAREKAEREAANAEAQADREHESAIVNTLDEWKDAAPPDDAYPDGLAGLLAKCLAKKCAGKAADYIVDAAADRITSWHDGEDWATILRAFPEIARLANLAEDAADWLLARYPEEDGETED